MPIYFGRESQIVREGVAESWQGVRARGVGQGGGVRGSKGVESIFKWSFQQNRYHYIEFGYRHTHYKMKLAENCNFRGFPNFGREFPCNDIIISENITFWLQNEIARDFTQDDVAPSQEEAWWPSWYFCSLKDFNCNFWRNGCEFQLNIWVRNIL